MVYSLLKHIFGLETNYKNNKETEEITKEKKKPKRKENLFKQI